MLTSALWDHRHSLSLWAMRSHSILMAQATTGGQGHGESQPSGTAPPTRVPERGDPPMRKSKMAMSMTLSSRVLLLYG